MDLKLTDKIALVSGSTGGIGLEIARTLAREGARVILTGRSQTRIDAAVAEIGGRATGILADVTTPGGAAEVVAAHPDVDILVNNLGIYESKPFADISDADWTTYFEVNVMSGVRLSRHYFPRMLAKNAGRVIFV